MNTIAGGRIRLIEVVGTGGMATVWKSEDDAGNVRAAKILEEKFCSDPAKTIRFQREGRTMARIDHPNVVRVYDVGEDPRPYMLMELVPGGSLVDWCEEHGPMPPQLAVRVMMGILAGLEAAHALEVVHRDLKPANVLLAPDGTPKLSDFGIAQVSDTVHQLTGSNAMLGTWPYMAPEQRANPKMVDGRSDLYSAGATLFSILTNETPLHMYRQDAHEEMFAKLPAVLHPILRRSTRYKQDDRFASAKAFREALITALPQLPADPADTPSLGRTERASLAPVPLEPMRQSSDTYQWEPDDGDDGDISEIDTFLFKKADTADKTPSMVATQALKRSDLPTAHKDVPDLPSETETVSEGDELSDQVSVSQIEISPPKEVLEPKGGGGGGMGLAVMAFGFVALIGGVFAFVTIIAVIAAAVGL